MLVSRDKLFGLFLKWKRSHRKIQNRVESLSSFQDIPVAAGWRTRVSKEDPHCIPGGLVVVLWGEKPRGG